MPRIAKIWKRKGRPDWHVTIGDKQINLGPDYDAAQKEFHRLRLSTADTKPSRLTVSELKELYLTWVKKEVKPVTYKAYKWHLDRWEGYAGMINVNELKPFHVTEWLKLYPWGTSTKHLGVSVVKIWSHWCKEQGYVAHDPLASAKRPKMERRKASQRGNLELFEETIRVQTIRDIFHFLVDTGCRPREARTLEANRVDWDASMAIVRGKRGERVIGVPQRSMDILRRLAVVSPTGTIFRTRRRSKWSFGGLQSVFRQISHRAKIKPLFSPYDCRHAFWGRAHAAGVSDIVIAKQLGHSDLKMLSRHYADVDHVLILAAVEKTSQHSASKSTTQIPNGSPVADTTPGKPSRQPRPTRSDVPKPTAGSEESARAPLGGKPRKR